MGCISKPRPTQILHLAMDFQLGDPELSGIPNPAFCITCWMTFRRNLYTSTVLKLFFLLPVLLWVEENPAMQSIAI